MERPLSSLVVPGAHGTFLLSMNFGTPMTDYWIHPTGPAPGAPLAAMLYGMVCNRG